MNGVTPLFAILSKTPLMYAATSIVASSARLMNGCSSSLLYFGRCVSSLIKLSKQYDFNFRRTVFQTISTDRSNKSRETIPTMYSQNSQSPWWNDFRSRWGKAAADHLVPLDKVVQRRNSTSDTGSTPLQLPSMWYLTTTHRFARRNHAHVAGLSFPAK